ncbi:hypothetical protein [Prescottella agglutinans]|uniref:Uncharacterized protein n=1 Tax=Prescottella agglutinans TaxID=1644129 RepID=A0ABT6MHX5_9NOCA|nr:hypothetical protein [Prescottella agglutinans]MDH6283933.1 hypothetical protein [Prescottella agglutinans]
MLKFFRRRSKTAGKPATPQEPGIGVRVDSAPAAEVARLQRFAADFAVGGPFIEPDSDEHDLWKAGKLVPWYISYLLDCGQHFGPEVDIACHAEEPAVDLWETGSLYPSWEQTVALARLLDVRVRDLTHPDARPQHHTRRPRRRVRNMAILSFEPDAVHAAAATESPIAPQ